MDGAHLQPQGPRVGGDDHAAQVEAGQQRGERRDLVAFGRYLALGDDGLAAVQGGSRRGDRRFAAGARAAHRLAVRVESGAYFRIGVRCVHSGLREEAGFAEHPRQAQGRQHAEVVPAPAHTAGIRHGAGSTSDGDSRPNEAFST
ncbi:hypothetical protein [Streptomyces mirabilis]|uniref:hypothetical protein n=1 Tax=Streptomyces mirabilis TaxID=68239 RepID=UPI00324A8CF5